MNPWPHHAEDEIAAAEAVLRSGRVNYWTGEEGRRFEEEFAAYHDVPHAVALANGTLALEAALLALEVPPEADVIVPPRTFIATAGAVVVRGARPVFADVDRESGNVTAGTITAALTPQTRAIIVVHLAGRPCDMDPILDLCRERNLLLIEDCAQAHGARYKGRPVGSFGDAAAFSFCQDKIMTTGGEGGMLLTSSRAVWQRAWEYKDHGKSWEAVHEREHPPGFRWLHESFGSNWRMTEMQAAIARVQLRKLDQWVESRGRNAEILNQHLAALDVVRVPRPPAANRHAYYKHYVYVVPEALAPGWDRDRIMAEFQAAGIPGLSGTCSEIFLEKAFADAGLGPTERLPVAWELGETSLMFPVHPTLTEEQVHHMGRTAREILERASA